MGGNKQQKKDFQKVKLKVGRTVNRGLNFTDTSFKSKKIAIRAQLPAGPKDIKEQFQSALHKIKTSNSGLIVDGLQTLNRIMTQLTQDKRQALLKRVGNLASHSDVQIRMGATAIVNKILDGFKPEQRAALADTLILSLQSSLTSLDWAVKVDGLNCLSTLFKHIPLELSKNYSVFENVMDLVSSTKEDLSGRKLNMELKCSKNHVKLWSDVCDALSKMIQCLIKAFHGDGKSRVKSCNGLSSVNPRIRWFTSKTTTSGGAIQLKGNTVANEILPVLLEMWSGVENLEITSGIEQARYDAYAKISSLMLTVTEWADLSQDTDFKTLPEQALNFFKSRFPLNFQNNACSTINLRIAKFLITIHGGKNLALNKTLFIELKGSPAPSDIKLLLDVATRAMHESPHVIQYVNSLFFTKKGQQRRPFYSFYLKACNEIVGDFHMNEMLLKMPGFISKIILQYPTMCEDEISFLESLHSLMLPAYLDGIGSLSLSTLEQLLRHTHQQSRLALRLILDQSPLRGDHMKIILDFWYEGHLTTDEMLFAVGHLFGKLEEAWINLIQEPDNDVAALVHIEHVNLISEVVLSVYLDLDEIQRPRSADLHPLQPKMQYLQMIHKDTLQLKSVPEPQARFNASLRHCVLTNKKVRQRVVELLWALLQAWEDSSQPLKISSMSLTNVLLLMHGLDFFGEDVVETLDKLINQLLVTQFLSPSPDQEVLKTCSDYYRVYGTGSFMEDLDQVMNADSEDCDDKLIASFARGAKYLRDLKLISEGEVNLDHIEDAMRLAEEDSVDAPSSAMELSRI